MRSPAMLFVYGRHCMASRKPRAHGTSPSTTNYTTEGSFATLRSPVCTWFKQQLSSVFATKDLGEVDIFLGLKIIRDRQERTL